MAATTLPHPNSHSGFHLTWTKPGWSLDLGRDVVVRLSTWELLVVARIEAVIRRQCGINLFLGRTGSEWRTEVSDLIDRALEDELVDF